MDLDDDPDATDSEHSDRTSSGEESQGSGSDYEPSVGPIVSASPFQKTGSTAWQFIKTKLKNDFGPIYVYEYGEGVWLMQDRVLTPERSRLTCQCLYIRRKELQADPDSYHHQKPRKFFHQGTKVKEWMQLKREGILATDTPTHSSWSRLDRKSLLHKYRPSPSPLRRCWTYTEGGVSAKGEAR